MAKFGKSRKGSRSGHTPRKLKRGIDQALDLFDSGAADEAFRQLAQLADEYPRSKPVLDALIFVCLERRDWRSIARYCEQLLPLEKGRDRAVVLNNLVVACSELGYPALVWDRARELVEQHPRFSEVERMRLFADRVREFLVPEAERLLPEDDRTEEEKLAVLVEHDRVRFFTEMGMQEKAIELAEGLLEKAPTFVPVLNNLSLAYFNGGDPHEAIAAAERALARAPENAHTLANVTRFCFLMGRFEEAHAYAGLLKELERGDVDMETKRAEALSYLGDDEGVRDAYRRVEEGSGKPSPLLLHLAAAASFRLGDEKQAWQLWRRAVRQDPSFDLALGNLEDRGAPAGKRNAPWYWTLAYWLPGELNRAFQEMDEKIEEGEDVGESLRRAGRKLVDEHPALKELFPHILERGDGAARHFIVSFIRYLELPELWPILYDFAVGRYGTDDLRLETIHFLREKQPDLLPDGRQVTMWTRGEQQALLLMDFEVHGEPRRPEGVPDDILEKSREAYELLKEEESEEAERILEEIIFAAPDYPAAHNHLAVAYEQQGRHEEARALVEETLQRFPDYLFARVKMARHHISEGRVDEARELLQPLLQRNRLHFSEFRALADAQIALAVARGEEEAARSWLEMWSQIEEDHTGVLHWRSQLEGEESFTQEFWRLASHFYGESDD